MQSSEIDNILSTIATNGGNDDLYYSLGNAYRRENDMGKAISAWAKGKDFNPDGECAKAYNFAMEIMNFCNPDMFNP